MSTSLCCIDKNGELLPQYKRFCELYSSGKGTPAQCMREADFSISFANKYGKCILDNPDIKAYLSVIDARCMLNAVASKEDVLAFWTDTMFDQTAKTSDRLNASKLLAEYLKLMDSNKGDDGKPIIIFDMGKAEHVEDETSSKGEDQ